MTGASVPRSSLRILAQLQHKNDYNYIIVSGVFLCSSQLTSLELLLGTEAPVLTPNRTDFLFSFSRLTD